MITLTQMAASTEPVQFSVAAIDDEGNSYDPTGDPLAVALGAVTSPPTAFDPGTATWYTATWSVQAGNPNPTYWVNVLFGPLNGGVPVTAGSYIAYIRVTDNPAVPIRPAAYLIFT